ncbi:MAG: azurin [Steroidobacteraceae bacterium]
MSLLRITSALVLLAGAHAVCADPCSVTIEGNDRMQFNLREITVPAECGEIEVRLKHSGRMPVKVMGHDWVLAKYSDMSAIVNAGLAAGARHGYLPENDKRIIAATGQVGGGESAVVRFSTSLLQQGERYAFFCTSPGHSAAMRGTFLLGRANAVVSTLANRGPARAPGR